MLAGLWQRRSSDSKDHTLSILRTREDYDISGFDPAALDRAKFYLNHIQESNHICGVGGLVLSSIFVKGFLNRRRCLSHGLSRRCRRYCSCFHTSKASWIFHGVACLMLSSKFKAFSKAFWVVDGVASTLNYLPLDKLKGEQIKNIWKKTIWWRTVNPRMNYNVEGGVWSWPPIEEWTRGRSYLPIFAAFELLIPLQRPSKPLRRILSKHTKQRIPTFSSLQSGNFPIKQTAPSGLTTYLTFHIIEISTIAGELVKFGNYLQTALFFSKRKEMKRSPFHNGCINEFLYDLLSKEVGPCRNRFIASLAEKKASSWQIVYPLQTRKIPILAFRKFVTKASQDNKLPIASL